MQKIWKICLYEFFSIANKVDGNDITVKHLLAKEQCPAQNFKVEKREAWYSDRAKREALKGFVIK